MNDQAVGLQRLGRYSGVLVVLSLAAWYGTMALSAAGFALDVHEGARASAVAAFAWIAVLAVGVNIPRYRSFVPFVLSDIGAVLVTWVLFVNHSRGLEILGFAMLAVGALRDRYLLAHAPAPADATDSHREE